MTNIIKIVTIFVKTIIKAPRKVKRLTNYVSKQFISVFLEVAKFADFR